ncbi:helix-turn-helix domain-containing protein [Providencia alcalifaciens]|uniref:helix-turn-helix domain-containing protein n=1 Tax=Providencia alcalifaciens TaxID=126385 RepID=UPI001CC4A727|nr:helix-turn-helix domain-containing protein [Providencia alcalifaciens]CAG9409118.1 HTH-type transcriptional regulator GadX [Providencia alcalifaciens]
MSLNFCEKTFHSYIEDLSSETESAFYLSETLLLTVSLGEVMIRLKTGEWRTLTSKDVCFLPKDQIIEMKKNAPSDTVILSIIPLPANILNVFNQQYLPVCIQKEKIGKKNQLCVANFEMVPIIKDIFHYAYQDINELQQCSYSENDIIKKNKISIYLNFILAFFLNVNEFIPALHLSINVSIKEKVYNLVFNNVGKQNSNLGSIAKQLYMSPATLKRRLTSEGTSFSQVSLMSRMNKAMMLSKTNNIPMTRIAQEVGYDDIPFFMSTFKKYYRTQISSFL